jgi:transcriptional regulator with XRE-family HTH domain
VRQRTKPHPVDVHVGKQLQARRILCGMTQIELARQLGITFQQLQKYETGANRVSASRLWETAKVLDTPVSYFFEGLDGKTQPEADILNTRAELEFIRDYEGCPGDVQKSAYLLCKAVTDNLHALPAKRVR